MKLSSLYRGQQVWLLGTGPAVVDAVWYQGTEWRASFTTAKPGCLGGQLVLGKDAEYMVDLLSNEEIERRINDGQGRPDNVARF